MTPETHSIEVRSELRLDGKRWWRSYCSCGRYVSGIYHSSEAALRPGNDHANAKNNTAPPVVRPQKIEMELSSPGPGVVLVNHAPSMCEGTYCCIHNPSDHHMRDWPLEFRSDAATLCPMHLNHALVLTERTCKHECGHPDPDSLAWLRQHDPIGEWGIHGCCRDRCCKAP